MTDNAMQQMEKERMSHHTPTLDLRTHRPEGLNIGVSFSAKRGNGWKWFDGLDRWWVVTTTVTGFNGGGGYWITEDWRWNSSTEVIRREVRSLTAEQSRDLDKQYRAALTKATAS